MLIPHNIVSNSIYPKLTQQVEKLRAASVRMATGDKTANGNMSGTVALSNSLRGKIKGGTQLTYSLQTALGYARAQETVMSRMSDIVVRMVELATTAVDSNKTLSDRQALQSEFSVLVDEMQNYANNNVRFNGKGLISTIVSFRYGNSTNQVLNLTALVLSGFTKTGFSYMTISTAGAASVVLASLGRRLGSLARVHSVASEHISRINTTLAATQLALAAFTEVEALIRNVDIAQESAAFIAQQIQENVAEAILSQANNLTQNALRYIQNL